MARPDTPPNVLVQAICCPDSRLRARSCRTDRGSAWNNQPESRLVAGFQSSARRIGPRRRLIAAFLSPRASRAPDSRGPSIAARESLEPSRIGAPGSGGRRRVLQPIPSVSLGAWKDTTRARFKRQQGVWQPLMMVTAASFGAGNAPFQRPQAATVGPAKTGGDSPRP